MRRGAGLETDAPRRDVVGSSLDLVNPYVEVLPVTPTTAERFGRTAANLRRKGRRIPSNDTWIAAHALESGADLLSFDRHFEEVDGLAFVHLR